VRVARGLREATKKHVPLAAPCLRGAAGASESLVTGMRILCMTAKQG
jgi:hypothetical protein